MVFNFSSGSDQLVNALNIFPNFSDTTLTDTIYFDCIKIYTSQKALNTTIANYEGITPEVKELWYADGEVVENPDSTALNPSDSVFKFIPMADSTYENYGIYIDELQGYHIDSLELLVHTEDSLRGMYLQFMDTVSDALGDYWERFELTIGEPLPPGWNKIVAPFNIEDAYMKFHVLNIFPDMESPSDSPIYLDDISIYTFKYKEIPWVDSVKLNFASVEMEVGDTLDTLAATTYPENAWHSDLTWEVSDESIIEIILGTYVLAKSPGTAKVTVTNEDTGWDDEVTITVEDTTTSINHLNMTAISTYPNPVRDGLLIVESGSFNIENIVIYNIQGAKIKEFNGLQSTKVTLNLDLEPGMYILNVNGDTKRASSKLLVK